MKVIALFYRLFHCKWCQQAVYEIVGTHVPHSHTCFGTCVLHAFIPRPLFPMQFQKPVPEVFGYKFKDVQLLPEPGQLICGKCKAYINRENIVAHTFCCQSAGGNVVALTEEERLEDEQFIPVKAFRIEFLIRFLCFNLLFHPLLQFGAIFFS